MVLKTKDFGVRADPALNLALEITFCIILHILHNIERERRGNQERMRKREREEREEDGKRGGKGLELFLHDLWALVSVASSFSSMSPNLRFS